MMAMKKNKNMNDSTIQLCHTLARPPLTHHQAKSDPSLSGVH
ncbi:hypothetical protein E2C01_073248 [Portunus trituberculatus]|uniref:Uncharacterized protein n=1 Tax=Portunus trituberculatus TaxID=210409 RepID=A0A5B7I092_PORTR|nr:hypothetical protein [Portunus trituberculatus]